MDIKKSETQRFDDVFGRLINLISTRMNEERDRVLAERGLNINLFDVMLGLMTEGGVTQTELARRASKQNSATSRMLERLESKELIVRAPDSSSGRSHRVCLTDEGRILCNSLIESFERLNQKTLESLSERDQQIMMMSLKKVASLVS